MNAQIYWLELHTLSVARRWRLYLNNQETPYFVDKAQYRCHFTQGQPVGLFGSGMHPSGCALTLGSFSRIRDAKARAIELALQGERQSIRTNRQQMIEAGKVWQVHPDSDSDNIMFEGSHTACLVHIRKNNLTRDYKQGLVRIGKLIWEKGEQ